MFDDKDMHYYMVAFLFLHHYKIKHCSPLCSPRFLCRPTAYLELAETFQQQQQDVNSRRTAEESRTNLEVCGDLHVQVSEQGIHSMYEA